MLDLKQKLAAAKKDYDAALAHLEKVRADYESGPEKEYAATKANVLALQDTIKANEATLEEAKEKLAKELRASNGKITDAVKKILSDRRNTDDILDNCREMLAEAKQRVSELRIPVSNAARGYQAVYSKAAECWWKVQTYSALSECGERLCEAMAVEPVAREEEAKGDVHGRLLLDETPSKTLILKELDRMLSEYKGDRKPYRAALGECNLGALGPNEFLTLAQIHTARNGGQISA